MSCIGEYYLKISPSFPLLSLPINNTKFARDFNPTEVTTEIWFKAAEMYTKTTDVIIGLAPYKIRKRSNQPQIHINYEGFNYCLSITLNSGQWYHFAFSISEKPSELYCYINGDR
jgi:hypothetical protein